ncbi:MAG TPA: Gldg family protein, partial [Candidatus Brocadiia bacterium]|nr:Gldg family protein [Candidatus Brocadiia bacterium]
MGLITFLRKHISPGGAAFLLLILLIAVLGAVNMLAFSTQVQWDLSENRSHSLSPATISTLQRLASPVRVVLVVQDPGEIARETLRLLESLPRINPRITFELLEKGSNAERVSKYQIQRDRFLVVETAQCFRWVPRLSEQNLVSAILQAARGGDRKVLFSRGAGELDLPGLDERGMGKAREALVKGGFRPVQDALTAETLKDASVVVIAAPATELTPQTVTLLRNYVANGGGLLALVRRAALLPAD